ncbi:50S ribosomal protein L25/general stress protein Ctc [Ferruginivarius sediminum]|uniref:Large ribosomal subunit protein bL25 n=1 Tax=Ferruginivarius sediminum TaxID=2661937 RepID=A0A369TEU5_9PROT|nr:50S ribosomal protein L25/general stress protein Ctc [Ferruginivarius sediminum]
MSESHVLEAQQRERAGKGAARRARRNGRIPGVIYGAGKDPVLVTFDPGTLDREIYQKPGFFTRLYDIRVEGVRGKQLAICRDLQLDPVTDRPRHLDFLRVSAKTEVTIEVPVHFTGEEESPGLKRGGVLNVVRHTVEMLCRADNMPAYIEVPLAGLEINDSAHISSVKLPEGARPTIEDRDFTIATIAAPSAVKAEAAEEQAEVEAEHVAEEAGEAEEAPAEEEAGAEGTEEGGKEKAE